MQSVHTYSEIDERTVDTSIILPEELLDDVTLPYVIKTSSGDGDDTPSR